MIGALAVQWAGPVSTLFLAADESVLGPEATRSSIRLGVILTMQERALLAWTRTKAFKPGALTLPDDVAEDIEFEMALELNRICITAYCEGVFSAARKGEKPKAAAFDEKALKSVSFHADRLADAFQHRIRTAIMPILEAVWTPDGTRVKPQPMLEAEIRTVYAEYVESAPVSYRSQVLMLAESAYDPRAEAIKKIVRKSRRMKVRDREQRDQFLKTRVPFSKWIKRSTKQIIAESKAPPWLKPSLAVTWVQTEEQRFHTMGVIESSKADWRVVGYRWTNSNPKHPVCVAINGMVLEKDDPQVSTYQTPLHHGCKTRIESVYYDEDVIEFAPMERRPDPSMIDKGFGKISLREWAEAA